jgi:tRNA(Leu) C34 or U34 (ribose-2'-O)-methylase TrmL
MALRALMSPTLFVEFSFKAFRHPRCCIIIIVRSVAPWTGRAGTTAAAGMFTLAMVEPDGFHKPSRGLRRVSISWWRFIPIE